MKKILFLAGLSFVLGGCFANKNFVRQCTPLNGGLTGCAVSESHVVEDTRTVNKPNPPPAPKIEPLLNQEIVEEMDPIAESLKKWCPVEADPRVYDKYKQEDYHLVHRLAEIRFASAFSKRYPYGLEPVEFPSFNRRVKYACNFLFVYYKKVYEYELAKRNQL